MKANQMRHAFMDGILEGVAAARKLHDSSSSSEGEGEGSDVSGGRATSTRESGTTAGARTAQEQEALMRGCVDRALQIFDTMRASFKHAELISLAPGRTIVQHSTMILMQGSLIQKRVHVIGKQGHVHHGNHASHEAAFGQQHEVDAVMPVYKPPSLLLWLPDFLDMGLARFFKQGEAVKYIAGPSGATVLACDADPNQPSEQPDQASNMPPSFSGQEAPELARQPLGSPAGGNGHSGNGGHHRKPSADAAQATSGTSRAGAMTGRGASERFAGSGLGRMSSPTPRTASSAGPPSPGMGFGRSSVQPTPAGQQAGGPPVGRAHSGSGTRPLIGRSPSILRFQQHL